MEVKLRTARSLVRRLSSSSDEPSLAATMAETRQLTKHDPEIRLPLIESGVVPLLSAHLNPDSSVSSPSIQEDSAACLLNLSIASRESLMSTPGILDSLNKALQLPDMAAQHAAACLYSLLCVESYRPIIGSKTSILVSLISLLRSSTSTRTTKDVLKALFGLALYPLNRPALIELGIVPALFSLIIKDGRSGMVEDVTAVIGQVAGCGESVQAFRKVAGVRVLVDLVDQTTGASQRSRENAISALLNLVLAGGEKAAGDLREIDGGEGIIRDTAKNGEVSSRGKAKAEALVKALESLRGMKRHDYWRGSSFDEGDDYEESLPSPPASASSLSRGSTNHDWR
ncbi:hypothetical protein LUZ60_003685 [Juncus effusus]|nr:hypothetical protein LUZ60_003685 [Juncus effusus]